MHTDRYTIGGAYSRIRLPIGSRLSSGVCSLFRPRLVVRAFRYLSRVSTQAGIDAALEEEPVLVADWT